MDVEPVLQMDPTNEEVAFAVPEAPAPVQNADITTNSAEADSRSLDELNLDERLALRLDEIESHVLATLSEYGTDESEDESELGDESAPAAASVPKYELREACESVPDLLRGMAQVGGASASLAQIGEQSWNM